MGFRSAIPVGSMAVPTRVLYVFDFTNLKRHAKTTRTRLLWVGVPATNGFTFIETETLSINLVGCAGGKHRVVGLHKASFSTIRPAGGGDASREWIHLGEGTFEPLARAPFFHDFHLATAATARAN